MAKSQVKISGGLKSALEKLSSKVTQGAFVDVGYHEDATYPDGTPVAMVAAIQDGGAPKVGIPPRPFFRDMVKNGSDHWGADLAKLLPAVDYDAKKALAIMGEQMMGELQQSIVDILDPPLSPVTLMLRKMKSDNPDLVINRSVVEEARAKVKAGESYAGAPTKPLVDTGQLLRSVDAKVREK